MSPSVLPSTLRGSACPPDQRCGLAFKRRRWEVPIAWLTHQQPRFASQNRTPPQERPREQVQVETILAPVNRGPITCAEIILQALKEAQVPVSGATLAGLIVGYSFRDVAYRLKKAGKIADAGHGTYALGGAA